MGAGVLQIPDDTSHRRLAIAVLVAAALHGLGIGLWGPHGPPARPGTTAPIRVTIERHAERPAAQPPPPSPATAEPRPSHPLPASPREPRTNTGRTPVSPPRQTAVAPAPDVDVATLLQSVPRVERDRNAEFPLAPREHPIFQPEDLLAPEPDPGLIPDSAWIRSRVTGNTRYASLDGRGVWIKRFDNGEMQVCEKPYENPFIFWDDSLPFACDRPSK